MGSTFQDSFSGVTKNTAPIFGTPEAPSDELSPVKQVLPGGFAQ